MGVAVPSRTVLTGEVGLFMDHARRLIDMQMLWRMQRDDVKKKTSMDRNEHDIEVSRTPK